MATSLVTDFRTTPGLPLDGILLAEELLDLAERAQAYTNAAGVAIALLRRENLLVRTSTGSAPDVGSVIPATDSFIAECIKRRKPLCCRDTESDSRIGPGLRAMRTRSLIAIPIGGQPEARGVMLVIAPLPNAFQPTHTAILMTLSDIIGSKLAAREACEMEIEIVDDPPSALAVTPEPPQLMEMPVVAPISIEVAPPPVEVAPTPIDIELETKTPAAETPNAPVEPAATASIPASITAPAVAVPPALLKTGPLPLVEDKKSEIEPGLLSPSEDPGRFKPQRAFSGTTATAIRPEVVKIARNPVALAAIAPAPAAPVRITAAPALASWEAPREESTKRRILLPGLAVAAVLVVAAVLWMHRSTSVETSLPTNPVPAAVAATLPSAAPLETAAPPVAKSESAVKGEPVLKLAKDEDTQPKPAKAAKTPALPQPKPQPVIEIAATQPKPKLEPEPEMPAPKLAPTTIDAVVASLGAVHVALPVPPKSELVAATVVSRVAPVYPAVAKRLGISGLVVMDVTIAPDGSISAVRVTNGAMQLRSAAADAVRQWRYKPATLNGKPVESSAQVQVNFTR